MKEALSYIWTGFLYVGVFVSMLICMGWFISIVPTFQPRELVFLVVFGAIFFGIFALGWLAWIGWAMEQSNKADEEKSKRLEEERREYKDLLK